MEAQPNPNVTITITSAPNMGKSVLSAYIARMLREVSIDVTNHDEDIQRGGTAFHEYQPQILAKLSDKIKVAIVTEQLPKRLAFLTTPTPEPTLYEKVMLLLEEREGVYRSTRSLANIVTIEHNEATYYFVGAYSMAYDFYTTLNVRLELLSTETTAPILVDFNDLSEDAQENIYVYMRNVRYTEPISGADYFVITPEWKVEGYVYQHRCSDPTQHLVNHIQHGHPVLLKTDVLLMAFATEKEAYEKLVTRFSDEIRHIQNYVLPTIK
jgi:hypothetical protein